MIKKINEIIENVSCFDEIESENDLELDLELDSLDRIELIMKFEQEFNIQIPDSKIDELKTVQDIYDLIESKTK